MKQGRQCRCTCGCTIWISATSKQNDQICRFCAGPVVFGKQLAPQCVGSVEPERHLSGARRKVDRRPKCRRCGTPIKVAKEGLIHVPGYYTDRKHEATV